MGWNPITSKILKSRLKSWPFALAINAHIKRISFRLKEKRVSKYYDTLTKPIIYKNSNKLINWSKNSIKKVFFVGTADYQDKAGLIQGLESIFEKAELAEQNSNQILEFTKEAKNLEQEKKIILIEALWSIIYSDEQADIYETNFMRRVTGLIYLDNKLVGDIKLKVKNQKK